ncbi:MAG: Nif3-like dinuclear metal center hexameric protein [Anaerovorax sp.]
MHMNTKKLIEEIEKIAPRNLEESWDNCGMQIDAGQIEVGKVLISLEITREVIEEAGALGVDFIIAHHPLLFDPIRRVDQHTVTGAMLFQLIQGKISVYAAHTTFDAAWGGNNDYIASILKLEEVKPFADATSPTGENHIGRMGRLKKPCTLQALNDKVAKALKIEKTISCVGYKDQEITTVGICSGAGGDLMELALACGCQAFITGDVKHHSALWAKSAGLAVIDGGHYGTEHLFIENFGEKLRTAVAGQVEIIESQVNTDPFQFYLEKNW